MAIDFLSRLDSKITSTRWRSLKLYNLYRLIIAVLLFLSQGISSESLSNFNNSGNFFLNSFSSLVIAYFIFSTISAIITWLEKPNLDISLPAQIVTDIIFIVLIMHTQQGSQSSIGLLLIVTIAAGSLISVGRLALFYAAIASISILLEQTFHILNVSNPSENYTSAVLLSLGCFATAWLAYSLAKRSQESELLACLRALLWLHKRLCFSCRFTPSCNLVTLQEVARSMAARWVCEWPGPLDSRVCAGAGCSDGPAHLALPVRAARPLGPRPSGAADAGDREA
jgi:two-component system sensor histidine kinase PilS (NtrC family)